MTVPVPSELVPPTSTLLDAEHCWKVMLGAVNEGLDNKFNPLDMIVNGPELLTPPAPFTFNDPEPSQSASAVIARAPLTFIAAVATMLLLADRVSGQAKTDPAVWKVMSALVPSSACSDRGETTPEYDRPLTVIALVLLPPKIRLPDEEMSPISALVIRKREVGGTAGPVPSVIEVKPGANEFSI